MINNLNSMAVPSRPEAFPHLHPFMVDRFTQERSMATMNQSAIEMGTALQFRPEPCHRRLKSVPRTFSLKCLPRSLTLALGLAVSTASSGLAQSPPPNDDFAGAPELTGFRLSPSLVPGPV